MEIAATIKKVFQELIVPEMDLIRIELSGLKATLEVTNKRIDDLNGHLIEQGRRIDEVNKRIDEVNKRIDEVNKRIDGTNTRIDNLRVELKDEIAKNTMRIDETNKRIDRLYEVIVRREEHEQVEVRLLKLEQDIAVIKERLAA